MLNLQASSGLCFACSGMQHSAGQTAEDLGSNSKALSTGRLCWSTACMLCGSYLRCSL